MGTFTCPICGSTDSCTQENTADFNYLIKCKFGYRFCISEDIPTLPKTTQDKLYNLIFEHIIHRPISDNRKYWHFLYHPSQRDDINPPYYNLADVIQTYPAGITDRTNRTLLNLSTIHPKYGDAIRSELLDMHATYSDRDSIEVEAKGIFDLLVELGYLNDKKTLYTISADGWKKVEALRKKQQEVNQGFIAMSFRKETNSIRESFRIAIMESGYAARLIDEKEHNNQIVPEIFYEIERSKFIVVDITYPNYGAYYEAGYAQGLGKQVIVCCKRIVFENKDGKYERPHFDISQKSMIIWDDEADLVVKLKRRIEATVR